MTTINVDDEILLRRPTLPYADELFALVDSNRAYLGRWLPWVDYIRAVKDEREWIKGLLDAGAEGWVYPLMIMYKGLLVGSIGILTLGSPDRASEIGYWLAENVQGRGIATRACRTLLDYAFGSRGMNRLQIRAAVDNTRSRAIPERLRFTFEGVQRQAKLLNDDFQDLAVYSMLAAEWQLKRV